jgi:hypothetical protein
VPHDGTAHGVVAAAAALIGMPHPKRCTNRDVALQPPQQEAMQLGSCSSGGEPGPLNQQHDSPAEQP